MHKQTQQSVFVYKSCNINKIQLYSFNSVNIKFDRSFVQHHTVKRKPLCINKQNNRFLYTKIAI